MIRTIKKRWFTNAGSPFHKIYKPIVDKFGVIDLKESGVENTDDMIQSHAASCDIQVILNRAANGDLSGLNARTGFYADVTEMPKTYAEFLQMQIDATNMFNGLPIEIKTKFNNDPNQFLAQSGNDEWFEKLGYVKEEIKTEEGNKEE